MAVMRIEHSCFVKPWSENLFMQELLVSERAHYFVLEVEEGIVGYIGMWLIMDEAHITSVAVAPSWRHKGLGRQLVNYGIDYCARENIYNITLEVREHNDAAIGLYQSLGFEVVGKRPKYYQAENEDALVMWRRGKGE